MFVDFIELIMTLIFKRPVSVFCTLCLFYIFSISDQNIRMSRTIIKSCGKNFVAHCQTFQGDRFSPERDVTLECNSFSKVDMVLV